MDGPVECPGWPPAYTEPPASLAEPSTAAEHDATTVAHSHVGQQQPHVHTAEALRAHRRPIVGERVYPGGVPSGSTPATWHAGPHEAAAYRLRRWAETVETADELPRGECAQLARDLRGAASVLDGSVTA